MSEGRDGQLDRKDDGEGHVEQLQLPPDGGGRAGAVGEGVDELRLGGVDGEVLPSYNRTAVIYYK